MNEADDAILELLRELEISGTRVALPPTAIWFNLQEMEALDRAPNTISRRMKKLTEMDLVEQVDEKRGYYRITDKGLAYLDGDLDADDLRAPEDE